MYQLDKKVDEYSESLFTDLGLSNLQEEEKADIYARVQEHIHSIMFETLTPIISAKAIASIREDIAEENYRNLEEVLHRYPKAREHLEKRIQTGYNNLKNIISEELKHGRIFSSDRKPSI